MNLPLIIGNCICLGAVACEPFFQSGREHEFNYKVSFPKHTYVKKI